LSKFLDAAFCGAGGLGIPGVDALHRIRSPEDRQDDSAHRGGEETVASLPRHAETALAGGVETNKSQAGLYIQSRRPRYPQGRGGRLYAPDGAWIHVRDYFTPYVPIHGISAKAYFPDVLKLPRERLELLQLGWRASDEGSVKIRPVMTTTQPWQVFAWAAARYGTLYIYIDSVNLTREGGESVDTSHRKKLETKVGQEGSHRSGGQPLQTWRVDISVHHVVGRGRSQVKQTTQKVRAYNHREGILEIRQK